MLVTAPIRVMTYSKVLISIKFVFPQDSKAKDKLVLALWAMNLGKPTALHDLIVFTNSPKGSIIYSLLDSVVMF